MRAKGQVTIPGEVRELLNAREGDDLVFRANEKGQVIVERAQIIPPDQAWFWTERWQRMEREAQADIEAGRTTHYENVEKAISDLEALEDAEGRTD
jgi:AbrB family looped-hinge helix DNA binding protein